jgi:2-(1,2-epoxy-1,2-dihydrophenyl)acetyl-CoA isomerase
MSVEDILVEQKNGAVILTLNRPDALNALTESIRTGLLKELDHADREGSLRCVVMRGSGRAFSVGQDLKELEAYYGAHGPELGRLVEEEYIPIVQALRSLSKPTVAVLEGPAVGGGMALALAADFRLVTPRARLVPGFVNVGLAPDTGTAFLLGRSIGYARALSLCLTGQAIDAEEMVRHGLADAVHESPELLESALDTLTDKLVQGPTLAYGAIRKLFDASAHLSLADVLRMERDVQDELAHTSDHQEAVRAFLSKATPVFRGQ